MLNRCPIPETLARPEDLEPLVSWLNQGKPVSEPTAFTRGTLLPDGRLDLCKQGLGPEGAAWIARAVAGNTFVRSLLLGANGIGTEGAKKLEPLLVSNPELTTLFLGCNRIEAPAVEVLSRALEGGSQLRALWLKRNPIGNEGARALARALLASKTLRTLDLVQTGIDDEGIKAIVGALERNDVLQRLYIAGNPIGDTGLEAIAKLLATGSPRRALYLGGHSIEDEAAARLSQALSHNTELETLSLRSSGLGSRGIAAIAAAALVHPRLRELELGSIPARGILKAPDNTFDDAAAATIAGLVEKTRTLRRLEIGSRALTPAGIEAILEALAKNATLVKVSFGKKLSATTRESLARLLAGRPGSVSGDPSQEDVRAIRSVYRTSARQLPETLEAATPAVVADERTAPRQMPSTVTSEELATCSRVLEELARNPDAFRARSRELAAVRAGANRLIAAVRGDRTLERHQLRRRSSRKAAKEARARDRALVETAGIRRARRGEASDSEEKNRFATKRLCYICKARYKLRDAFYDALCPACAELHKAKRTQSGDLGSKIALVTGGRMKIGYQTSLKLLRAGATVVVTTRFPIDAAVRYSRESDFAAFRDRLEIHGLDLRHLAAVERFARSLAARLPHLDVVVNNAAQTIRRPSAYYAHLLPAEQRGLAALPELARSIVCAENYHAKTGSEPVLASLLTQLPLIEEDLRTGPVLFPDPADSNASAGDLRERNSWSLRLGNVTASELVEVHCVNALGPFVLLNGLLPALERSPGERRFVVNVSAMEGKFDYPNKQSNHPHTNMAKAALNMLTRTCAGQLAAQRIYMNSVDTGWITNEQPHAVTQRMRQVQGFEPPLDEIDGAARILDPVLIGWSGGEIISGAFLKDYRAASW